MKTTTSLNKENVNESRRDLLKGITTAAVVGGVVAAGISTQVSAAEKPQNNEQPKLKKGYHETQHIRDYFDSL
ncbi:MAG TPA: transcriptional initiation protein Tat [Vibrio sp.]|uniref:twin-arginine translocation signal domain-containing protein n=1 Tax=Vibrio TaxID=662 RepID=UPI000EC60419|nr:MULTISPECIES: twin-arginine translocation signal domain-containing protein [Vibrio]HCH00885.1 transcriptional initiation protein Tat [Vibrio sp.]